MKIDWVAVDWGTSNLRIWAMGANGDICAQKSSDQGMNGLMPHEFEPVLLSHIESWLGTEIMQVVICGMAGSRQGWCEAPYACVPTKPIQEWVKVKTSESRLDVRILSGIKQQYPADVMRGEETQIAGFLTEFPDYEGVICLPGTHSKWVRVQDQRIINFQTALTGELFGLLTTQSVLRHSLGEWDDAVFVSSLQAMMDHPETMMTVLFSFRAGALLGGDQYGIARISASLIGAELAGMTDFWKDNPITIIGAGKLARLYALALESLGTQPKNFSASDLTLNGLRRAHQEMFNGP